MRGLKNSNIVLISLITLCAFFAHNVCDASSSGQMKILPESQGIMSSHGFFGDQVALSGDHMMVVSKDVPNAGAIHYFKFENGDWVEKQQITPTRYDSDIQFGSDISLHNNTLVVGAASKYRDRDNNSVYVFQLTEGQWVLEQKINSISIDAERFGNQVALEYNTLLFSAEECRISAHTEDCVVEFKRSEGVWAESQLIKPSFDFYGSDFGQKLVLINNELYIGAPGARDGTNHNVGGVFHYQQSLEGWQLKQVIFASDGSSYDDFGQSIGVYGNSLIVGAFGYDGAINNQGIVYEFNRVGKNSEWQEVNKLSPHQDDNGEHFGYSLSIHNNRVLVGAGYDIHPVTLSNRAYLFEKSNGQWSQTLIENLSVSEFDQFSHAVAINENHIIITDPTGGDELYLAGSVHSYVPSGQNWTYHRQVEPLMGNNYAKFGSHVDSENNLLVISGPKESNGHDQFGSVNIYRKEADGYSLETKLTTTDVNSSTNFGYEVDISSDWLAVSSPFDSEIAHFSGAVFMYQRNNGWQLQQKIVPSVVEDETRLGISMALDGSTLAIGAPNKKIDGVLYVGTVYIYELEDGYWTKTSVIQPNEIISDDQFGRKVALQGNHLMIASDKNHDVGGIGEIDMYYRTGSNWEHIQRFTDLNANYSKIGDEIILKDNMLAFRMVSYSANSGAVGILKFDGVNWSDFQLIYPSDFTPYNEFGSSMAFDQKTLYVGASESTDFGFRSGAVYQYNLMGDNWHESQKIQSSDQLHAIGFGYSQTLSEGVLCIGAPYDSERGAQAGAVYCQKGDVIFMSSLE